MMSGSHSRMRRLVPGVTALVLLGSVTAVRHGAGRNEPMPLANLDEAAFLRTLAPKIAGLEATLAATDPASLKLLITFGSIIGRAGLRGQADYATANDWLTDLTRRFDTFLPGDLVLSDRGTRDAFMHAIQCCVPNATFLPRPWRTLARRARHGHRPRASLRHRTSPGRRHLYLRPRRPRPVRTP